MATKPEDPQTPAPVALAAIANPPLVDSDTDNESLSGYSLPTFPELAESSKEQQSLLTRSQYAMVVFHGVADTYPTDSDIICHYSLTDGVEAAPGDRIVLFAVGWSSIKDYVVFEWAPIPEKDERDLTVVFKATDLPKDVNEFYQVCYVNNESAICGASIPFQVRTPNNEELTFALEEDMVVVRSSTAVAQDRVLKAQLDQENLNKKKINLEKQLHALEDKHGLTLRRLDRLQETLSKSNALNEELNKEKAHLLGINEQMLSAQQQWKEAQIKLSDAEQEKIRMEKDFQTIINNMRDNNHHLEALVKSNENKLMEAFVQNEIMKKEHEKLEKEIAIANRNLQQCEHERANLEKNNFVMENELTVCKFNLNNAQQETVRLATELEELATKNKKFNEELKNKKHCQEMHENFYAEYSCTDRGRLMVNNAMLQRSTKDLQLTISRLEHEKFTLKQVLEDTLDAQNNVHPDHCTLEKRVAQLQYRLDEALENKLSLEKKQSSSHTDQPTTLEKQVESLSKLLNDSLKENDMRLQENMALRVQNEILEMSIAQGNSKSEEYVIVSSSNGSHAHVQHTGTVGNPPHGIGAKDSQGRMFELHTENEKLRHQLIAQKQIVDEYASRLTDKDKEIQNLGNEMQALIREFQTVKGELQIEIANLISKNAAFVVQESESRELKNEMQKLTFMNGELLTENSSLMKRIHDNEGKCSMNTGIHELEKSSNSQDHYTATEIENTNLRDQFQCTSEQLNTTEKQAETTIVPLDNYKDFQKELANVFKITSLAESNNSKSSECSDIFLQRLIGLVTKASQESHESFEESRLKEISQSIEHLVLAVQELSNSSKVEAGRSVSPVVDDLKHRLQLAREEYEKLHTMMVWYATKCKKYKIRLMKITGKNYSST